MKKLLMLSYYWPPLGGPGSLRPVKFAKYLPDNDIEPIVLTRKDIAYHSIDTELHKDVETVKVIRTESLDPARILYLMGMRTYHPKKWQRALKQGLNFPDHKLPWLPFACSAAQKLDYHYVLATAPPFSAFIIGYVISKQRNKPLILDFRDAWLEFPFLPYRGALQRRFVLHWERKLIQSAALITVVDENIKEALTRRYPTFSHRIQVLPNGYDEDDFRTAIIPDHFTITHIGTIREERNPLTFLDAVQTALRKNNLPRGAINVKFIGHVQDDFLHKLRSYDFVSFTGHLPYRRAIEEFCASHCGFLITTGHTYFFPSRQNEYLASGLPIIVCGKSKGIHLLQHAFLKGYPGWVFDYNDTNAMSAKIYDIYQYFQKGKRIQGTTPYPEYTRQRLTSRLAILLRALG